MVLVIGGLSMTYLASKTEIVWSWNIFDWNDEIEYFDWLDRVGIIAIAYFLIGVGWIIGLAEWANRAEEITLFSIWAVYLIGIAIQGFREETETPWRRGLGSFGSLFSIFMLSLAIETELFRYVLWMLLGIVAFGFGILYMNRMGEGSMVYDSQSTIQHSQAVIPQARPVQAVKVQEKQIVQPQQEVDSFDEEFDVELEKTFSEVEEQQVTKLPTAKPVQKSQQQGMVIPAPVKQSMFDIQLDPSVLAVIQQRIAMTPHIGFRPVVTVQKNGNVNLTFEKV